MNLNDIDEFKPPNRKPWLILVVLILAGFAFLYREEIRQMGSTTKKRSNGDVISIPQPVKTIEKPVGVTQGQKPAPKMSESAKLLEQAKKLESERKYVDARKSYQDLLKISLEAPLRTDVETRLGKLNTDLILTPYAMPEKVEYIVQSGDSVDKIAKKVGATVELICKSNRMTNPNLIKAGDRLRVFVGKFSIKVSKSNIDLVLSVDGQFFKRYNVGTGKFGRTPVGTFVINDKIKEPVWWTPNGKSYPYGTKENILGTHWMSIRATGETPNISGYGIHGTWDPESIGKAESAGCIRMKNEDVEELFTIVPVGTPVEIVE